LNCEHVCYKLFLYMEKELEPFLAKRIERHLKNCIACQKEFDTLAHTLRIIKSVKAPPLPRDYSKIIISEKKSAKEV